MVVADLVAVEKTAGQLVVIVVDLVGC